MQEGGMSFGLPVGWGLFISWVVLVFLKRFALLSYVWRSVYVAVTITSLVVESVAIYLMFEYMPAITVGWHPDIEYMFLYLWNDVALNVARLSLWMAAVVLVVKAIRRKKWSLKMRRSDGTRNDR